MSAVRERRRCPLKSWGPFGGNDFWGNPQEGVAVFPGVGEVSPIEGVWVRTKIIRSSPIHALHLIPANKGTGATSHYTYSKLSGVPKKYRSEAPPSEDTFWGYFPGSPKSTAGRFAPEDTFWGKSEDTFWGKSRSPCRGGRGIGRTAKVRFSRYSAAGVKSIALPQ